MQFDDPRIPRVFELRKQGMSYKQACKEAKIALSWFYMKTKHLRDKGKPHKTVTRPKKRIAPVEALPLTDNTFTLTGKQLADFARALLNG